MPHKKTEANQPHAPALTKERRAGAEVGRMARLRTLWMPFLRTREKRQRARRAELLSIPRELRTPAQDAELDALTIAYLMAATGALGLDCQVLADAPDKAIEEGLV